MQKYQAGTVFQLYEDDTQEYMVVHSVELEGVVYLLVSPVNSEENNLKMDAAKMMLLKVDKTNDEMEFESDENVINKVIENII